MYRVFVVYETAPDPERYAEHVELCMKVPNAVFRHGPIKRTLSGEERFYYGEFEFPDSETFKASASTEEWARAGRDAGAMGYPHTIYFAEVSA